MSSVSERQLNMQTYKLQQNAWHARTIIQQFKHENLWLVFACSPVAEFNLIKGSQEKLTKAKQLKFSFVSRLMNVCGVRTKKW